MTLQPKSKNKKNLQPPLEPLKINKLNILNQAFTSPDKSFYISSIETN